MKNIAYDSITFMVDGALNNITCFYMAGAFTKRGYEQDMVIDCTKLTMIDGTGLGMLVELYMRLKENDHTLTLRHLNGQPLSLIKTLGLLSYFKENEQCQPLSELQKGF